MSKKYDGLKVVKVMPVRQFDKLVNIMMHTKKRRVLAKLWSRINEGCSFYFWCWEEDGRDETVIPAVNIIDQIRALAIKYQTR